MHLKIITPEHTIFDDKIYMVNIPGTSGIFGVLDHHSNFISSIKAGVVEIFRTKHESEKLLIASGTAEITNHQCIILTDNATHFDAINQIECKARIAEIEKLLSQEDLTPYAKKDLKDEMEYLNIALKN